MSGALAEMLMAWAEKAFPEECCGILYGEADNIRDAQLTANVAENRASHFEIDPGSLLAAHRKARDGGPQVIGYFHSHPNGMPVPSVTDANMALPDGRIWLIIAADAMTAWRSVDSEGADVLHGRFQQLAICFTDSALVMGRDERH